MPWNQTRGVLMVHTINQGSVFCHTFDLTKRIDPEVLKNANIRLVNNEFLSSIPDDGPLVSSNYDKLLKILEKKLSEKHFKYAFITSALNQDVGTKSNLLRVGIDAVGTDFWDASEDSHQVNSNLTIETFQISSSYEKND